MKRLHSNISLFALTTLVFFLLSFVITHSRVTNLLPTQNSQLSQIVNDLLDSHFEKLPHFISSYPQLSSYVAVSYASTPGKFSDFSFSFLSILLFAILFYLFIEKMSFKKVGRVKIFILAGVLLLHPALSHSLQSGLESTIDLLVFCTIMIGFSQINRGIFSHGLLLTSFSLVGFYLNSHIGIYYAIPIFLFTPIIFINKSGPLFKKNLISIYLIVFFPLIATIFSLFYLQFFIGTSNYVRLIPNFFHLGNIGNIKLHFVSLLLFSLPALIFIFFKKKTANFYRFLVVIFSFFISTLWIIASTSGNSTDHIILLYSFSVLILSFNEFILCNHGKLKPMLFFLSIIILHWWTYSFFLLNTSPFFSIKNNLLSEDIWIFESFRAFFYLVLFWFFRNLTKSESSESH